jgi:Cu2+-containing amine oxidase
MASYGDLHWVSGAGWSLAWRIQKQKGSGVEIWFADFMGKRVMWRGSAPFAIVPYHRPHAGSEPPGPEHCYKDGLDIRCGGAEFRALRHFASNSGQWWQDTSMDAGVDTEAVVVNNEPADDFNPAALVISAKFQCGWYQYVHSWEFSADGSIHPKMAMGGQLNPFTPSTAHLHNFYFRIDLDIDGQYPHDVVEVFNHSSVNDPGGDAWKLVDQQGKLLADPQKARKWRIRNTISKNAVGEFRSYEFEVPQESGRDKYSTGDVWVTVYRSDSVQQGEDVGASGCSDIELEKLYAIGPLDTTNGNDIVLWVAVHSHHEPRNNSEEATFLPYHYAEFSIRPRSFEIFKELPSGKRDRG